MPKTVLITGCSKGGIGDALVQEFHSRGLRVFATARDLKKLEHLHALGVDLVQLDVSDPESIVKAVEVVKLATGGTLDFLVNNSGSGKLSTVDSCSWNLAHLLQGYVMPLLDADISKSKKMFDVNVWGLLAVTQQFAPLLIAAKGTLLNVASIAAYTWVCLRIYSLRAY
jgi:1-acylglycerone phosphate reductase